MWKEHALKIKVPSYRRGFLGLVDHFLDVLQGRPIRCAEQDYTLILHFKSHESVDLSVEKEK